MKPKRIITCNIRNYENMTIKEINALINWARGLQNDKNMNNKRR